MYRIAVVPRRSLLVSAPPCRTIRAALLLLSMQQSPLTSNYRYCSSVVRRRRGLRKRAVAEVPNSSHSKMEEEDNTAVAEPEAAEEEVPSWSSIVSQVRQKNALKRQGHGGEKALTLKKHVSKRGAEVYDLPPPESDEAVESAGAHHPAAEEKASPIIEPPLPTPSEKVAKQSPRNGAAKKPLFVSVFPEEDEEELITVATPATTTASHNDTSSKNGTTEAANSEDVAVERDEAEMVVRRSLSRNNRSTKRRSVTDDMEEEGNGAAERVSAKAERPRRPKKMKAPLTAEQEAAIDAAVAAVMMNKESEPAQSVEEDSAPSTETMETEETIIREYNNHSDEREQATPQVAAVVMAAAPGNIVKPTDRLLAAHRQPRTTPTSSSNNKRARDDAPRKASPPPAAAAVKGKTKKVSMAALVKAKAESIKMAAANQRVASQSTSATKSPTKSSAPAPPATSASTSTTSKKKTTDNPLVSPDYREHVLIIFNKLAEINQALGERYKAASYTSAVERLKKEDAIFSILPPNLVPISERELQKLDDSDGTMAKRRYAEDTSQAIPGVGDKLRKKIVEILKTGDLAELHVLEAKPIIRAIQELTQVHGFGPRTAISFYKEFGIKSVDELRAYDAAHGGAAAATSKPGSKKKEFHLTDAQRQGLKYHRDIMQRIPHREGRLHEAFLKLRLRKYLGRDYELVVCGSYRRQVPTSGDIDVLITRRADSGPTAGSSSGGEDPTMQNALGTFVAALTAERYIEATLAQGPTKFMGVSRLRALPPPNSNNKSANSNPTVRKFTARRIDIRFVDTTSYPAALLYFTGSKNFNVVMRAKAIQKGFILNEYGLFRNSRNNAAGAAQLHGMIAKLARAQYFSSKNGSLTAVSAEDDEESGNSKNSKAGSKSGAAQYQELKEISKKVESLRVPALTEQDIFDAIGMEYVAPEDRNI